MDFTFSSKREVVEWPSSGGDERIVNRYIANTTSGNQPKEIVDTLLTLKDWPIEHRQQI